MMMTQNGKLLYISDNAAEYLGHSMVSLSLNNENFVLISVKTKSKEKIDRNMMNNQINILS